MLYNVIVSMGSFSMRFEAITGDAVTRIMVVLELQPKVYFANDQGHLNVQITRVGI